ncbi:hypothetical protein Tco_0002085 [Tanacetum coccineum]
MHRLTENFNDATRKDHFPLPFMDQMLERLAGNEYYCFLDGFSGYFQIPIDPLDQEKTTFTCPYGTFAYRRMPFGYAMHRARSKVNFAVGAVPRQRTTMHSSDTLCQANYGSRLNTLHNQRKKNYMTMILSKIALALPLPLLSSNELNLQSCLLLCYISSVAPVDFAAPRI